MRGLAPATGTRTSAAAAAATSAPDFTGLGSAAPAVGRHERIAVVRRRDERLLDRPRADPADQVPHRARLVVRARRPRAAERLLADHRAGRLVVDVEVAGRVAELFLGEVERAALAREDGTGQPVGRA